MKLMHGFTVVKQFWVNTFGAAPVFLAVTTVAALAVYAPPCDAREIVYSIDFSAQPDGDARPWLKAQGFEFRLDAERLTPRFSSGRLVLDTNGEVAALFSKRLNISGVKGIRIAWGVERYPAGANWERGVYRVPIAIMVSFGSQKIESGALYVPNAPYFIGLFLGKNEREGRAYTANYYKKGGRYFCVPCGMPASSAIIVTEFDLEQAFTTEFQQSTVPDISTIGFQVNTKDTNGGARAFLKRIDLLG